MRVLVGLSCGVDSLATALLLKEQSIEVVGIYFQITTQTTDLEKIISICKQEHIEFHTVNLQDEFQEKVIKHFENSYLKGETPNICTYCNSEFKIQKLVEYADKFNCQKIATGHYAKIQNHRISIAKDSWKCQSYMLYRLTLEQRKRLILPLGNKTKEEVKQYVNQKGYNSIASKRESYGICFLQGKHYSDYLLERYPQLKQLETPTHKGYPFYTIGQKLKINNQTQYIKGINPQENTLALGSKSECYQTQITLHEIVYHTLEIDTTQQYLTKIRGKDEGNYCQITKITQDSITIKFDNQGVFAPMKGQDVVLYDSTQTILLGGRVV